MKRLSIGQEAPDFEAEVWNGSRLKLSHLRGSRVWLAFFRYASCPLCNLRVHQMIEQHEMFEKLGVKIVAVFQSPEDSIAKYVGSQKPPFPLLTDPKEELYGLYRLGESVSGFFHPGNLPFLRKAFQLGFKMGRREGTVTRIPADFLIDAQGIVRECFYGDKIADHIPFPRAIQFAMGESERGLP